jgi:hypothetical protein
VEYEVVVERILEVGEGCSIVKIIFIKEGIQKNCTTLAIVVVFLFFSNSHEKKI